MNAPGRQTELILQPPETDVTLAERDIAQAHAAGESDAVARLRGAVVRYTNAEHPQDRRRLLQVVRELRAEYHQRRGTP